MSEVLGIFDIALVVSAIRLASPILLAALGGMFCDRAGIFNIGLEGQMLVAAFAGVAALRWTGSWVAGVAFAVAAATALGLLFGLWVVDLRANPIVAGLGVNLLGLGLTAYLTLPVFGVQGAFYDLQLAGLPDVPVPLVGDTPVLGELLSGHSPLVPLAVLLVGASWWTLFRQPFGIRLRAVGEDPEAARAVGVSARRLQYAACGLCGVLCGLAGAQLSLGLVTQWVQGMTAGRGIIALVAVMLARSHPVAIAGASLLFGLSYAMAVRLQGIGVAPQVVSALPYVITIAALLGLARSTRVRARLGVAT